MTTYPQTWTCADCDETIERQIDELDAAFDQTREWNPKCPQCGCDRFSAMTCQTPKLSRTQLEKWRGDDQLTFCEQDEDIILAEKENLGLLVEFVDDHQTPDAKRWTLLSALCVLLYDHSPASSEDEESSDAKADAAFARRVQDVLSDRRELVTQLEREAFLDDYVKRIVFPAIGLPVSM